MSDGYEGHRNLSFSSFVVIGAIAMTSIALAAESPTTALAQADPVAVDSNDSSVAPDGSQRVIDFPADRSIGTLKLRDWDDVDAWYHEWEDWREAAGRVTVPAGKALGLFLSREACNDLSVLEMLGADDIQLLSFPFLQIDEQELEHLAGLTGLQELQLPGVVFNDSDAAMARIKQLRGLKALSLMHHKLSERGLAHVGEISSLETLILYNTTTDDAGLAHLRGLKSLRRLLLSETSVTDDGLAYLTDLKSLTFLDLFQARRITDAGLVHVGHLDSLETLGLGSVGITDQGLSHLSGLTSLRSLRLDQNPTITGEGLQHLSRLTRLEDLNIQGTGVGNEGLAHLRSFRALKKLNIANTYIDDAGLKHLTELPALENLRLPRGITDRGLSQIGACIQLEELDLPGQSLTADGVKQLAALPRLRILRLEEPSEAAMTALRDLSSIEQLHLRLRSGSTQNSGEGFAGLHGVSNLVSLHISNNQHITDDSLAFLAGSPGLEQLNLFLVPIGDGALAHLSGLEKLTDLTLGAEGITDAGMTHLAGLTSLKHLSLEMTSITDEGLTELTGLTALEYIGLGETKVTGAGMARLMSFLPALVSSSGPAPGQVSGNQLGNRSNMDLKPGDPAPSFVVPTLDGESLSLEDFRGKVVLLDFWATWCGPCVAAIPELKLLLDEFGNDGRFTIISLSSDEDATTAREFVRERGLIWPQGYAGRWSKTGIRNDYGIIGIPAYFLIGPDGKILAVQSGGLSRIKAALNTERIGGDANFPKL